MGLFSAIKNAVSNAVEKVKNFFHGSDTNNKSYDDDDDDDYNVYDEYDDSADEGLLNFSDIDNDDYFEKLTVLPENITTLINDRFDKLDRLEDKINTAMQKAKEAEETAKYAKSKSMGIFGGRGSALDAVQDTVYDLAHAQRAASFAQRLSFEYQKRLTKISNQIFLLGVGNIALNQMVVREVSARLKGASAHSISELARKTMQNVIKQLKDREAIEINQQRLSKMAEQHDSMIKNVGKGIDETKLEQSDAKEFEQNAKLEIQTEKDEEQDIRIERRIKKDEEHDKKLELRAKKDEEHDKKLELRAERDESHDEALKRLTLELLQIERDVEVLKRNKRRMLARRI